jgi:DNA-binding PadR family transcriptional regulator
MHRMLARLKKHHRAHHAEGFGRRAAKMLGAEELQDVILFLLEERPRHGYEIIRALEQRSRGLYVPSPGMIYPALTYLEEVGYASVETEGTRKLYSLTKQGKERLAGQRADVEETLSRLERFGTKMAAMQQQMSEDEQTEDAFGAHASGDSRKDWKLLKREFREVKHALKSAIFEKMDAPLAEKKRIVAVLKRAIEEIRHG